MCGIAGILDLRGEREIDRNALQRMTDALIHRGPDGEGLHLEPGLGLGHRRLAIIDREGGGQPFHAADGRGVLSFNGEIYNYQELGKTLAAKGAILQTRSDTECLAEGLSREGPDFVHQLRGMFAFAYWDHASKTLTLGRDRLGEKPLYYAETGDGFLVFASEITAIAASRLHALEIDNEAAADYFLYGYVPDPKSIYRGVRKLPPGALLAARRGGPVTVSRYWRPHFESQGAANFEKAAEELIAHLDEAVRLQMISDVPLGGFLSGGVDSSAIVSSMALNSQHITTCTIGFDDAAHDERAFARIVAEQYGTEHFEETASLDVDLLIDDVATAFGEPFADSSALPTYVVSKLARNHVTVALSGDGGDEIFAGYRRYPFFLAEEKLRGLAPLALRRPLFGTAGALWPKLDWAPRPLRLKTTLQSLGDNRAHAYARAVGANLPDRVAAMLAPDFKHSLGGYDPVSVIADIMPNGKTDPLSAAQTVDLATWLPGRMLTKIDRASMAHSLEVRPPLLDHKLVEWAGALPPDFKLRGGEGKRILKKSLEPRLGANILFRRKQGFGLPIASWLRAANGPLDRLNTSNAWRQSGFLNEKKVDRMIRDHQRGRSDNSQELWTVIMFDAFQRTQIGA